MGKVGLVVCYFIKLPNCVLIERAV